MGNVSFGNTVSPQPSNPINTTCLALLLAEHGIARKHAAMRSKNSGTITFFIDIFFMVYKNSNNAWNNQIYKNLLRELKGMLEALLEVDK